MEHPTVQTPPRGLQPARWPGLIERYRAFLPVDANTPVISLNEGNTPLVAASRLQRRLGADVSLYLKLEGANPTGSFKDRGMTMAVSKAIEAGSQALICASTGNTSASMAAYAARAGVRSFMLVPHGYVALGKLAQGLHYGATVISIEGNFDQALQIVRELAQTHPVTLVNSVNPHRIAGQQTGAFEVVDQLGEAPDYLAIPVGNAGNITAYWRGFEAYHAAGLARRKPVMLGFQAAGAAPIVLGAPVAKPETIATAIRIGNPASWCCAEYARQASRGAIAAVTDAEILAAYDALAREEGIFCEPASAASLAGVLARAQREPFPPGSTVVCVLTGNGLKDPDTAIGQVPGTLTPVAADVAAIGRLLGL
ncbi:MAG: threonine synthase [Candidatus Sericytochromatia bacterium]|nr:threonine synthase [Candidatus Sericytochromatia bacterium]